MPDDDNASSDAGDGQDGDEEIDNEEEAEE